MKLSDFNLITNKQRSNFCYSYELRLNGNKLTIFTMNGGKSFTVSKEIKRLDNRYYTEFSKKVNSIEEALIVLSDKLK